MHRIYVGIIYGTGSSSNRRVGRLLYWHTTRISLNNTLYKYLINYYSISLSFFGNCLSFHRDRASSVGCAFHHFMQRSIDFIECICAVDAERGGMARFECAVIMALMLRIFFLKMLLVICGASKASAMMTTHSDSPLQYFYADATASARVSLTSESRMDHLGLVQGLCNATMWKGRDPEGMSGHPSGALVRCEPGSFWNADGMVNEDGHLRFYLWYGSMTVRLEDGSVRASRAPGSSFWVSGGTSIHATFSGAFYVVGSSLRLARVPPSVCTSSYFGLRSRFYDVESVTSVHDVHINNGTGHIAKDILFSSLTNLNPPNIIVLNCAPSLAPQNDSFVFFHSHPQGAMYIPFSGKICFETYADECIKAGEMRWTSPNLYYRETFHADSNDAFDIPNEAHRDLVPLIRASNITENGSIAPNACDKAVVFAVTNFDPGDRAGQPNFVDAPHNARLDPTRRTWGYWKSLLVSSTVKNTAVSFVAPRLDE